MYLKEALAAAQKKADRYACLGVISPFLSNLALNLSQSLRIGQPSKQYLSYLQDKPSISQEY